MIATGLPPGRRWPTACKQLHDTTQWRVTLVLDGKMGTVSSNPLPKRTDMVISYATADQTADSIIERLVAASGLAADILVITADEAEKLTVEASGAMTASPAWLREELEREGTSSAGSLIGSIVPRAGNERVKRIPRHLTLRPGWHEREPHRDLPGSRRQRGLSCARYFAGLPDRRNRHCPRR